MGLDSIELLMEVENYFGIQIPDAEAEKIYTVRLMLDCVAKHLNIINDISPFKAEFINKVITCLPVNAEVKEKIKSTDRASNYISPFEKEKWTLFRNELQLEVPKPDALNPNPSRISEKFKKLINWKPNYEWDEMTFEEFVNGIAASNYRTLLSKSNITSKYEIYIAIIGLTVDKVGVDYFEITPDKSFTDDLGVD